MAEPRQDALTLAWLVRLRWALALGAALLIVTLGPAIHVALPLDALFALGVAFVVSNAAVQLGRARAEASARKVMASLLLLDGALLTAALYLTGGASNPFAGAFLVLIVLAAAALGRRAGALAVAASITAVALVGVVHRPLLADHDHGHGAVPDHDDDGAREAAHGHPHPAETVEGDDHLRLHAKGTGMVFAVVAGLVAYLVTWALGQRERELQALRAAKARNERLADVGAFATSAAHELGTPLATIAVVAKELERALEASEETLELVEDARTIRGQVDRCREVLDQFARVARGESEEVTPIPVAELLDEARGLSEEPSRVRCRVAASAKARSILAPRGALVQVLRSLIANALRADARAPVELSAEASADQARIRIHDRGEGMAPELLEVVGEAPLSSRQGLGVGLFVGRAILERLGGTMTIDSTPGRGTCVTLELPLVNEAPVKEPPVKEVT
ncbi:MAG: ATP-binding protein [Polyangiaceae bacterium]